MCVGGPGVPFLTLLAKRTLPWPQDLCPWPHLLVLFTLAPSHGHGDWRGMVTQPNSSPQWKNTVTCPPGSRTRAASASGRAASHTCPQGPCVFHLLKNQRLKDEGASLPDTVDWQCDMTFSDPRTLCSLHARFGAECRVRHLTAVSTGQLCYLKWAPVTLSAHQHLTCPLPMRQGPPPTRETEKYLFPASLAALTSRGPGTSLSDIPFLSVN